MKNNKVKILHLLTWDWACIRNNLKLIKEYGWDGIQVSPLTTCKAVWTNDGKIKPYSNEWWEEVEKTWWLLYQPTYFKIGNHLGNFDDFKYLCDEADKLDLMIIPDYVLRHTANDEYDCLKPHNSVDKNILDNPEFFLPRRKTTNYKDRYQVIWHCTDLPALNYNDERLFTDFYEPLIKEISNLTPHFRLDQMKHYALRDEGGLFLDRLMKYYNNDGLHYGECIFCDDYIARKYYDEYNIKPLVQDYQLFGFKDRVAFFESHDTHRSLLSTLWMTDNVRLEKWNMLLSQTDYALYYARRWDNTIFSDEMKEINFSYN